MVNMCYETLKSDLLAYDKSRESSALPALVPDTVAAQIIGSTPATLRRWRYEGLHLRYFKVGSSVRYKVSDLEEFLATRVIEAIRPTHSDGNR
jgi:hypothetical protein